MIREEERATKGKDERVLVPKCQVVCDCIKRHLGDSRIFILESGPAFCRIETGSWKAGMPKGTDGGKPLAVM